MSGPVPIGLDQLDRLQQHRQIKTVFLAKLDQLWLTAASLNEVLLRSDPGNAQFAMALAITLRYSGDLLSKKGVTAGALANSQRVINILDQLATEQPGNVLVQGRRAEQLIYIADLLERRGNKAEAEKKTAETQAITRKLAKRDDATADDL